jgi:hypothetical protein
MQSATAACVAPMRQIAPECSPTPGISDLVTPCAYQPRNAAEMAIMAQLLS